MLKLKSVYDKHTELKINKPKRLPSKHIEDEAVITGIETVVKISFNINLNPKNKKNHECPIVELNYSK